MKFQFRAVPPNNDIVLDNAHEGYEAENAEYAWAMLANKLWLTVEESRHLRTRYTIEPFGTVPSL